MKVKSLMIIVIGCLAILMVCPALFAQEEAEFFGGYSFVKRSDGELSGWGVSAAADLHSGFAAKLDVSGVYSTLEEFDDSRVRQYNVMGGAQYTKRFEKINIFVEGLAGLGQVHERADNERDSVSGFVMAFGGGLDWKFSPKIAWRVAQADYMPLRVNGTTVNGFRFQTGILIPFGK